jgi:hypothetical protein
VALGGTGAWAADKITSKGIAKNAVRAKHIKKGRVKAKHVKKNAVRTKHIRDGAVTEAKLVAGLEGPQGPPGRRASRDQSGVSTLGVAAFRPVRSATDHQIASNGVRVFLPGFPIFEAEFHDLPAGATITGVEFFSFDID